MGLDITSYRKLRRVACEDRHKGECDHAYLYPNADFPGREGSVTEGCYDFEEERWLRAGSYSGYNAWREALAALVGLDPNVVWNAPSRYADRPFFELVNFSDCEGVIGPEVAAELAKDFAEHEDRARAEMHAYEFAKYREWRAAFEMAADGGAVAFH